MPFEIYIFDAAQDEYDESIGWYGERNASAMNAFISEVESMIDLICADPYRWRGERSGYREVNLSKYPFTIVYLVDNDAQLITITSIYHHKRHPSGKYKD